ncbi:MAG TPA: DciA family protein [Hyphomicrobiales bacterium]|nr:DciA family protein [Hyphomicrobiales bacterium]
MTDPPRRSRRPRQIAELIAPCLGKALAAQGFAEAEIVTRWGEIAGPELAARSRPLKLQWPRRRGKDAPPEPGTLIVLVEGAFALELEQQAPIVIERLGRLLGWGAVAKLRLKQGPVARPALSRRPSAPQMLAPAAEASLERHVAGFGEERLAEALKRLGRGVVATR